MSETPLSETLKPLTIRMHESDNVAIVANDGGLPAGTTLPEGLTLRDKVPQGHKVALVDLPAGGAVLRYGAAGFVVLLLIILGFFHIVRRTSVATPGAVRS